MSLYFETSSESLNKFGEELCGDKVEISKTPDDVIIVLADGLGSGVKANILSSLTSKIVSTMFLGGADIVDVVETMASTLPVCKERNIAYSTFTILHVQRSGEAHLIEYDNPPLVVLRGGRSLQIQKTIREIAGKTIREANFTLQSDDLCVLFSDGAVHAGVGKLLNLGWQQEHIVEYLERSYRKGDSAFSVTRLLLSACDNLYQQKPGDDTTVVSCKLRTPCIAYVMVGPPVNREDDERIVHSLLASDGKRIVCGGTTSQIVSRVSGRELKVNLRYITPDVPPVGDIAGIDLVTEGVVTLGKTLEQIRRFESGSAGKEALMNGGEDGASKLARMLVEQCTEAQFVVGRSLNPAHQNTDLPIDLSLKLRLVEDISTILRRLGKNVRVEYV